MIGEVSPALEHPDRVALLGESQRRHAAAETRADHQPVEIEVVLRCIHASEPLCSDIATPILVTDWLLGQRAPAGYFSASGAGGGGRRPRRPGSARGGQPRACP